MAFCSKCGASITDDANVCVYCGKVAEQIAAAASARVQVMAPQPPPAMWYVTSLGGRRGGPYTHEQVVGMIARQQIRINDAVLPAGGTVWMPITQSPFAPHVAAQTNLNRLASSTCPLCGAALVPVVRSYSSGTTLIIMGILFAPLLIGIALIIVGIVMNSKARRVRYQCPRCGYTT